MQYFKQRKILTKQPTNSCSRVLLEKLIVAQLVTEFPAFYGTHVFTKQPTTCPFPEPDESSSRTPIILL
jgi:hypothetical protein